MATANIFPTSSIMKSVQKVQKVAVTYPAYQNLCVYYVLKFLNLFFFVWNLAPEATFIITNLHDVKVCTSAAPTLCQLLTTLFKLVYLAIRNKFHLDLFFAFEACTRERRSRNGGVFYDRAEKISLKLTIGFLISVAIFIIVYIMPTLVYQFFLFLVEPNVDEPYTYMSPFKHVYFYSVNSHFRYIVTVFMGLASTTLMGINYLSIDLAFFSYCLYIQAFYRDMQTMFKFTTNQDNVAQLEETIKFHTEILKMIQKLNNLFSPMIFAQFLDSSMLICLVIFQSTIEVSVQSDAIKNYLFVFGAICQILVYSFFGTMVSDENFSIAMAAYSSEWTDPDLKNNKTIKKHVLFIIHRSQIEVGLDGLKLFKCNLHTFISIMNASLSCLAVLQSMSI